MSFCQGNPEKINNKIDIAAKRRPRGIGFALHRVRKIENQT
jgi:hypothetical protein